MLVRVLPILLFLGFLLHPLVVTLTGKPQVTPLEEYRKLAERPHSRAYFNPDKKDFLGFTAQLNAWYSDQFATRAFWVRLHTQILYSLFHESDQVHIGPDNWLFYRTVIDAETPALDNTYPAFKDEMIGRFVHLAELLQQRGITLYVMPLALKSRYYPEFLPPSAEHARNFRFYDAFMDRILADGRVHVIDSRPLLEAAKAAGLKLFHQTDFHWTDPAGAMVLKELLRELGVQEGKPEVADTWSYDVVPYPGLSGGEARAMPLFKRPAETSVLVELKGPLANFAVRENENGLETAGIATPVQPWQFSPVLVFGDSFFEAGMRSGFFNFFQAYAYARMFNNDLTEAYRNRQPGTRYMVLEYITSAAFGMDNYVTALIAALEAEPDL